MERMMAAHTVKIVTQAMAGTVAESDSDATGYKLSPMSKASLNSRPA